MIHDKPSIVAALNDVSQSVSADLAAMTPAQFEHSVPPEWSASGYLKHLLLSVKPFVRGLGVPKLVLAGMFGKSQHPPMTYQALTEDYQRRVNEGVRAEDFSDVTPNVFRMPADLPDAKAYLSAQWDKANAELVAALGHWTEDQLDQHQLPHPAIGAISVRSMLFFTVYHNRLHAQDIRRVGR
jgi:hypothetical protein